MIRLVASLFIAASVLAPAAKAGGFSLAEKFMHGGKLQEAEQTLIAHLTQNPKDSEARFGLGVTQFLLTFEHLGTSLHEHGLRTERAAPGFSRPVRQILPQNPNPEEISYTDIRDIVQTFIDDLKKAEATLAGIEDVNVELPLRVGLIQVDLWGINQPISAALILGQNNSVKDVVVDFDRGDVNWLRGYCHFLCAWGEILLAIDGKEMFERTAHLLFERVDTPHDFLLDELRDFERAPRGDTRVISDAIAFIHLMHFPIIEPDRMSAAHDHLQAMLANSRKMWKHYKAETDDNNEWIPNPKQTGVLGVDVDEEMISTWLETVEEAEHVLQGKKLIPFWRGEAGKRGINLKRVFTEPRTIDPILWIQGTAATPYLEEGEITEFADAETLDQINQTFGGIRFFGFAFWFN